MRHESSVMTTIHEFRAKQIIIIIAIQTVIIVKVKPDMVCMHKEYTLSHIGTMAH